jgi:hypothetical protein
MTPSAVPHRALLLRCPGGSGTPRTGTDTALDHK